MTTQYTYARFWKCALQVNPQSYLAEFQKQDHGLSLDEYNQQLVKNCLQENIKVIGLADHANVDGVNAIRSLMSASGIVVFPGFEIASSEKAHFVCLFPEETTTDELHRYLGSLDITDIKLKTIPSRLSGEKILQKIEELGGFCFAAHVTDDNGLLKLKLNHIWQNRFLKAVQIPGTLDELKNNEGIAYRRILLNQEPAYQRQSPVARINAKDVNKPENLLDWKASCFIKMTIPTFEAFKLAFHDPESRIRLSSDFKEEYYSKINRVSFNGGYLNNISIDFSDHLNTVIGGRGTGKSTLIECIRYTLNRLPISNSARKQHSDVIKENLGKQTASVKLNIYSVEKRKNFIISRRYGEPPIVRDESGNVSNFTVTDLLPNVEIYGQNEIYEMARDSDSLRRLIDRIMPAEVLDIQEKLLEITEKLTDNKNRLLKAQERFDDLQIKLSKLPKMEEEAQQYKKLGLEEKLKIIPLLEREKQLIQRVNEEINRVEKSIESLKNDLPDTTFLSDMALATLPHKDLLISLRIILDNIRTSSLTLIHTLEEKTSPIQKDLSEKNESLKKMILEEETKIQKIFQDLPSADGRSGRELGFTYQDLLRQIESIKPLRTQLINQQKVVEQLKQDRRNLLADLSDMRSQRASKMLETIKKLNKKLKEKLRLTIQAESDKNGIKQFLKNCNLEGVGEKRLAWIDQAEELTPMMLAQKISEGKDALLSMGWGITPAVAEGLVKISESAKLDLEALTLPDNNTIELNVKHEGELFKPLERLSSGQQCTAILHLLLLENLDPLIIDQPEDNLDNAFIAERIVTELRASKTRRQFIFATHNANIPVFGDAEWIGVMSASQENAELPTEAQGAIDVPAIREKATEILEGGTEAFKQRMDKYGIK